MRLQGVSFRVAAGESVGIVGRTGSGKSSLIVALFRLTEPYQGTISLDGIDLLSLGLNDVRGRIAAIPQDPVLFSGTVRTNLDPYDQHQDAEIWEALVMVALKVRHPPSACPVLMLYEIAGECCSVLHVDRWFGIWLPASRRPLSTLRLEAAKSNLHSAVM